ncbi:zonula occludens toxin [Campylobacter fetus]|uniref:zonular occludens toxin domain-containing protein n=1 Tax=Campylobacter fetus TaxID=196 RepID=UPI0011CB0794|nr:zonular occludens toxin domain-containing protein [Campylobacter fetus]EAJ1232370.1 zonula occludens toxin [Campylobacter fetus]EAK0414201.1 zonula occludens toxin [Campylobacter fetus]TXF08758.1 zonula occludens toxin [Campylobacter fetus subsp. fetus]
MAIHYIIGNPGSGKSYYGVYILWDKFIKQTEESKGFLKQFIKPKVIKKYDIAYTNINEFKFDRSEKIIPFDFADILSKLTILFNRYKFEKATDEELIKTAKELKLLNSVFVIDEIHNFFNEKENEVLIWWLTYHRHLYQELYFITQDLSLVNNEYKRIAEFFYKAVDSSKRFFSKKFRYIQYSNYRLYQKDIIKTFHIDFNEKIFNLYHSGQSGLRTSFVKKYLFISLTILIFAIIAFIFFINSLSPDIPKKESLATPIQNSTIPITLNNNFGQIAKKIIISEIFYYEINCINLTCSFPNSNNKFDKRAIKFLLNQTEILYEAKKYKIENVETSIYFLRDDVFKILNITNNDKRNTDEKNNSLFDGFGSNNSSGANQK